MHGQSKIIEYSQAGANKAGLLPNQSLQHTVHCHDKLHKMALTLTHTSSPLGNSTLL